MTTPLTDQDFEDRRKHLELIQSAVTRMASSSATAKGWSLTIASASFGVAVVRDKWAMLLLGMAIMVWFSVLDMYYLHQERRFRDLYNAARVGAVESFVMNPTAVTASKTKADTYLSWSIFGFYIPLILAGVAVAGWEMMKV